MRSLRILFFTLLVSVLFAGAAHSAQVAKTDIQHVFDNWSEKSPHFKGMASPFVRKSYSIKTMEKQQFSSSSMPFYAVELEPEGFVIMNSDDRLAPVLAYSDTGSLNLEDLPQNAFRALLKDSMERNYRTLMRFSSFAVSLDLLQSLKETENAVAWAELSVESADENSVVVSGMGGVTNGPFLTTTWDQTRHFNKLCPVDTNAFYGYDGRAPVGCVAVVGAQIMNYYKWPYRGAGSHSYTDSNGSITGLHSVVFSDPYDWDNMQSYYRYWTTEPEDAVAAVSELMYETGVAVDMDYDSNGSSSYALDLNNMMGQAFLYDAGTYFYSSTNSQGVADLIRTNMLLNRPAYISIPGHAVVADGHVDDGSDEYFHINYGWGGDNDGWYLVDDIVGDPAVGCISGLYPAMVPVNRTESGQTNMSPDVSLEWAVADVRTADVQSVSVLQQVLEDNTFSDSADDFFSFSGTHFDTTDWTISSGGYSGNCFFKQAGGYSGYQYQLTSIDKMIPQNGAELQLRLKARLASDIFRILVSDDDGQSWNEEYSLTSYYNSSLSWQLVTVDLSAYSDSEILICFEYVANSYYLSGGVWLDEISFSGGSWYGWDTLQTFESVTGGVVTNLEVGTNTLAFQAFDGASYGARSPSFTVVVSEDDGDIDDDGLPDDWEELYFGGETNANPSATASNGVNTVMEAYIAGLDPTDPNSLFKALMTNANGFVVQWSATSGRVYSVHGATNLLDGFQPLETNILWPQSSWTDTVNRSENFYKIDVELQE